MKTEDIVFIPLRTRKDVNVQNWTILYIIQIVKRVLDKKSVLRIDTNPSDHFPISMTIKWNYHKINNTDNTAIRGKTKWDKVDKDLYIKQLMATK